MATLKQMYKIVSINKNQGQVYTPQKQTRPSHLFCVCVSFYEFFQSAFFTEHLRVATSCSKRKRFKVYNKSIEVAC